jgi:hypothetical protein
MFIFQSIRQMKLCDFMGKEYYICTCKRPFAHL